MAKETFIMMSLDEEKSKDLAKVIGSDTSRKILDYMGGHEDVSEAELAKKLDIPVSTVHYNIKHLFKAGLIESKEFKWSEKGKKIDLYNVARKLIIIAPKGSEGLREKLKAFLPVTLGAFVVSIGLYVWQGFGKVSNKMMATADTAEMFAAPKLMGAAEMEESVAQAAPEVSRMVSDGLTSFTQVELNYALWFLIGSMFAIVVMFLYSYWKMRR